MAGHGAATLLTLHHTATAAFLLLIAGAGSGDHLDYTLSPRRSESVIPERFYEPLGGRRIRPLVFTINYRSTVCEEGTASPHVLFIVRSATGHFERRDAIRMTWGQQSSIGSGGEVLRTKLVFLLGVPFRDPIRQTRIIEESEKYEDLIQADFHDTYANLTLKDIAAFQWAATQCQGATFVVVTSDEVFVDVERLVRDHLWRGFSHNSAASPAVDRFPSHLRRREVAFCYLFPCCTRVLTHPESKYHVQNGQYEGQAYPSYCSGTLYALPSSVLRELYAVSLDTPSFMPDDAWIGVLFEKLGISVRDTYSAFVGINRAELPTRSSAEARAAMNIGTDQSSVAERFLASANADGGGSVVVAVLDYAYPQEEHDKMIEIWHAMRRGGRQQQTVLGEQGRAETGGRDGSIDQTDVTLFLVLSSIGMTVVMLLFRFAASRHRQRYRLCRS